MAREVYQSGRTPPMPAGQMALTPSGLGRFAAADLDAADLDEFVTIEIDAEEDQLVLRAPRRGETPRKLNRADKADSRATLAIGGALLAMGLAPADLAGRHDVVIDDGQLIVSFAKS
jgi:hypothetical protein